MGRSIPIRFTVQTVPLSGYHTPAAWRVRRTGQIRGDGQPTDANLARYADAFNASVAPGGVNSHLGPHNRIVKAWIVDHFNGNAIVARWTAPEALTERSVECYCN